jgi:hypothetical protein
VGRCLLAVAVVSAHDGIGGVGKKSIYRCGGEGKREGSLRNGQARGMIEEKAEEEQEGGGRLYMSSWVARALLLWSCRGK